MKKWVVLRTNGYVGATNVIDKFIFMRKKSITSVNWMFWKSNLQI